MTSDLKTPWHYMRDRLVEQFNEEIGLWLAKRIGKVLKKYQWDCMDNFGVAEMPTNLLHRLDPFFLKKITRFKAQQRSGCCGRYDGELTHHKTGRKFAFGFNYGH